MNKLFLTPAAALMAVATAMPATAAINARQIQQRNSIDAGIRGGTITGHEARVLRQEQNLITRAKLRMKARHGGHLTAADNDRIHAMQDAAARHIDRKKSNMRHGHKHIL